MTHQRHGERIIPTFTRGDRLRKARSLTGLTTREFATEIGVSQVTVTKAENDGGGVRKVTLMAWSLATGVPLEWLVTGEPELHTPQSPTSGKLPRLDSNQQPSGYQYLQVIAGAA